MKASQAGIDSLVQQQRARQAEIAALPTPKTRTPTKPEAQAPAPNEPGLREGQRQSVGEASRTPGIPDRSPADHSVASVTKRQRKGKPAALKNDYRIEVNTTLARRDKIEHVANALGISMSTYLLLCEENAVHELVVHFTGYLETRALVTEENTNKMLSKLEGVLDAVGNAPQPFSQP